MKEKSLTDAINLFIFGEIFVPNFVHSSYSSIAEQPSNFPNYPPHFILFWDQDIQF
jgi:hypothetical protein